MLSIRRYAFFGLLFAVVFFAFSYFQVQAMTSDNYRINWDALGAGGLETGTSTNYALRDTIGGQGEEVSGGGQFLLSGGYRIGDADISTATTTQSTGQSVTSLVFLNNSVTNITATSARVNWITDHAANASLSYGTDLTYASGTIAVSSLVTSHNIDLTGLSPGTTYYYRYSSTDADANTAVSTGFFSTLTGGTTILVQDPPGTLAISNVQVTGITNSAALVTWTTNIAANSLVQYGPTTAYGSLQSAALYSTSHFVYLEGLTAGTAYHFIVVSSDQNNVAAASADQTFVTLPGLSNVFSSTAVAGDAAVYLSWVNPMDSFFSGVRIVRRQDGYPANPFDGIPVYIGSGTSFVDTGLVNGALYFYGVYAYDTQNNFASGALIYSMPSGSSFVQELTPAQPVVPPVVLNPLTPGAVLTPATTSTLTSIFGEKGTFTLSFFGNGGAVELAQDSLGYFNAVAGSNVLVKATISGQASPSTVALFHIGSSTYELALTQDGKAYRGIFTMPSTGAYESAVRIVFSDNTYAEQKSVLNSRPPASVVEDSLFGPSAVGVSGASVQLYQDVNGTWAPYRLPLVTDADGSYAAVVPNGRYFAEVTKEGYRKVVSAAYTIEDNIFAARIALIRIPAGAPLPDEPIARVVAIVSNTSEQLGYELQTARELLQSPQVKVAAEVTGPVAMALTLVNVANSMSLFNILAYLQYIFTQPLLFFGRRKRQGWGVVFNSLTKQPIDLAIVRLLRADTRTVVQTKVTGRLGQFAFLVKEGKYLIEVAKPGYMFPTSYLREQSEDVEFVDLYHGDTKTITGDQILAVNIPVDPVSTEETPRRILLKKFTYRVRHLVAFSGILIGMVVVVIAPSLVNGLLLLVQVAVYVLFRRLSLPQKVKKWGLAFDAKTQKPIAGAIVRIFDKKFNKLLETQATDQNGKYGFFVGRNVYYLVAEKDGYTKYVSADIDLSQKDGGLIDQNLPMVPVSNG